MNPIVTYEHLSDRMTTVGAVRLSGGLFGAVG
jgi:hypothetical protein